MCGKNKGLSSRPKFGVGSPPRVREKLISCNVVFTNRRITPACAGKTSWQYSRLVKYRDHPRVCGKNLIKLLRFGNTLGSPPRVREKRRGNKCHGHAIGITPACAGKTDMNSFQGVLAEDHPRVCGKNTKRSQ